MSRIYEQLKTAQRTRFEAAVPKGGARSATPYDRRRSPRIALIIPVFVYGYLPGRRPFHEEADLLHVSAEGGLLILATHLRRGQKLLLTNKLNQKEQKCFVVHLRARGPHRHEVGVEFSEPSPEFVRTGTRRQ